jgi:hypothetical protein
MVKPIIGAKEIWARTIPQNVSFKSRANALTSKKLLRTRQQKETAEPTWATSDGYACRTSCSTGRSSGFADDGFVRFVSGLPLLVIGKAAIEVIFIFLASVTRPTARAYTKAINGTSLKRIGQTIHYLSGQLRCIQLLHESAITSMLNPEFILSTVPQHRKARRKRRHVLSYGIIDTLSRRMPCRQHAYNATQRLSWLPESSMGKLPQSSPKKPSSS